MTRPRACGALIDSDKILMVRHVEPTRSYWTLPGGGWKQEKHLPKLLSARCMKKQVSELRLCTYYGRELTAMVLQRVLNIAF